MAEKLFITANQLLEDSFRLGRRVLDDGFRPDFIVGIWRGGAPVGIAVQELLAFNGVESDHIAVRTSSYGEMGKQDDEIRVYGLHYLLETVQADDKVLLVDDTFDSGRSLGALIDAIRASAGENAPRDIKSAVIFYKPTKRKVAFEPDYFMHETDKWVVFPHELVGLSDGEIRTHKPAALRGG